MAFILSYIIMSEIFESNSGDLAINYTQMFTD